METNGIDLTKCNNCRFRAIVDENTVTGKIERRNSGFILTGDNGFGCVITLYELDNLLRGAKFVLRDGTHYVSDFEIVPRNPETYRDWQVGDKVTMKYVGWNEQIEVIFRSGELVVCKDSDNNATETKTCEQLYRERGRLVLTDIEKQIIEERKKAEWKPQDGDICYAELISDWVFIKKDGEFLTENYAALKLNDGYTNFDNPSRINNDAFVKMIRIATEGEKQKLFDAMEKKGKRWNAKKKVVEDIPKLYEFKKGEPVLVRDDNTDVWRLGAFIQFTPTVWTLVTDGIRPLHWKQCIPYNERTMHLLGTAEDYKEGE